MELLENPARNYFPRVPSEIPPKAFSKISPAVPSGILKEFLPGFL